MNYKCKICGSKLFKCNYQPHKTFNNVFYDDFYCDNGIYKKSEYTLSNTGLLKRVVIDKLYFCFTNYNSEIYTLGEDYPNIRQKLNEQFTFEECVKFAKLQVFL